MSLLERYGYGRDPGDSRVRLLRWLADLEQRLAPDADVDRLMGCDTRRVAFMLEGLLRLYRRRHGALEPHHRRIKRLEDALGAVDHADGMARAGEVHELPGRALAFLHREREHARSELEGVLVRRWAAGASGLVPGVGDLVADLVALAWDDAAADRTFLQGAMARGLRKLEKLDLDMGELEAGIHELRRRLRWLPIQLTALGDFTVLVDGVHPVAEYAALLDDPVASSPYAMLPPAGDGAVPIARSLYVANTKAIGDLGGVKDAGQLIESVAHALRASGVAPKRKKARDNALALLGRERTDWKDLFRRGKAIRAELRRTRLARHLREAIIA